MDISHIIKFPKKFTVKDPEALRKNIQVLETLAALADDITWEKQTGDDPSNLPVGYTIHGVQVAYRINWGYIQFEDKRFPLITSKEVILDIVRLMKTLLATNSELKALGLMNA